MDKKQFKLEAQSDEGFPFTFYIEKAIAGEDMIIEGIASTVNIDHDNERMSASALVNMADIINERTVPLRIEHQKDDDAICGNVFDAHVDERNQLWIKAQLDKNHPASEMLYKRLKEGMKLGLSVGGRVKRAVKEFSEAAGKTVKTFYDVMLDEVSVTQRPANYDSWLLAKSIISKNEDSAKWYDSPFYNEFLSETRGLDFMQSFAKSVPDKSWKKIELSNNINKDMTKEEVKKSAETTEETKEKAMETETKEKSADDSETKEKSQEAFKSYVVKGFETLTSVLGSLVAKMSDETKEKAQAHEVGEQTEEKSMDSETKEKAMEDSETKEKAMDSDETKEKAMDEDTKESEKSYGEEYQMKSIIDRLDKMTKAMDSTEDTKEKSQAKEEGEVTEKSEKGETLATFLAGLENAMNRFEEKMQKSGTTIPGLRSEFMNMLRNDPEIQKSIKELGEKEPGFRKSRQFGNAFIKDRDGRMFSLSPLNAEKDSIEKSMKDNVGKTFKDVYKKDFSSVSNETGE